MDQRFLLDQLPALNGQEPLSGLLDLSRIGLIGFSMGGYGALRTLGAKIAPQALEQYSSIAPLLKEPSWTGDSRVKAGILFAPATFLVDAENLENITAPTLWVCGTADHVVEYEKVRAAWQKAVHSDRILVSYTACGHNVANNPAPPCALTADWTLLKRWADPVWDTWRLNNLNAHFVTAFMGAHLQGQDTLGYFRQPLPGFVEGTDAGTAVEMLQAQ